MTRRAPRAARPPKRRRSEEEAPLYDRYTGQRVSAGHLEAQSEPSAGRSSRRADDRARGKRATRLVSLATRSLRRAFPIDGSAAVLASTVAIGVTSAANRRIFLASAFSIHSIGAVRRMTCIPCIADLSRSMAGT